MGLPRIAEPTPLDAREEALGYHAMDHHRVNECFVDDFLSRLRSIALSSGSSPPESPLRVIDLGCGPGQIPILLCQRLESAEVIAIDSEVEMLEIAKIEIDIAGLLGRVTLHHADVCELEAYDDAMADAAISNTVMHHLDRPELGLANAIRLVRPGGQVFVRDLFRPETEQSIENLVEEHAGDQGAAAMQLLRQSFWASLTIAEVRSIARGLGIDDECVQMTSDRHWTLDWSKPV